MKVVLINPPENLNLRANYIATQYPINLGYLASVLKAGGYKVEIWDYVVEPFNESEFMNRIKDYQPGLIGITTMTNTAVSLATLVQIIKNNFPGIKTVAGGTHANALPERTMKEVPGLDYIIIGEGENSLLELCEIIDKAGNLDQVKGLIFRQGEKIAINPQRPLIENIDTIPFPDRSLVPQELYKKTHATRGVPRKFLNVAEFITARGCPNNCIFCAGHMNYGYSIRFRSAKNVLEEVKECIEKYQANHVTFMDDTFTLRHDRAIEIMRGLKQLGVSWDCSTRVNNVTPELLKIMSETGCRKVSFGVESSSDRLLKLIKKGITIDQVRQAIKWAKEAKIKYVEGTFILGAHPSETREEVEMAIDLMRELSLDFTFYSIIVPFPGTEVYTIMKERGYIKDDAPWQSFIFIGETPPWRTDNFTSEELVKLQKYVYRKVYLRPQYIFNTLKKIDNLKELKYFFESGKDFLLKFFLKSN